METRWTGWTGTAPPHADALRTFPQTFSGPDERKTAADCGEEHPEPAEAQRTWATGSWTSTSTRGLNSWIFAIFICAVWTRRYMDASSAVSQDGGSDLVRVFMRKVEQPNLDPALASGLLGTDRSRSRLVLRRLNAEPSRLAQRRRTYRLTGPGTTAGPGKDAGNVLARVVPRASRDKTSQ